MPPDGGAIIISEYVQADIAGRKVYLPEGVTLTGVWCPGSRASGRTGYGLHSGEPHKEVGAEGAKHTVLISQAKGQRMQSDY